MVKEIIQTVDAPDPIGPYSQAVKAGGFLFISGQVGIHPPSGELVNGDIVVETKQVMNNLKAILHQAGLSFNEVVKCSIFVKDMNNFAAINEAYGGFFENNPPARETVEVSRLPMDVNVEISCIAAA